MLILRGVQDVKFPLLQNVGSSLAGCDVVDLLKHRSPPKRYDQETTEMSMVLSN